MIDRYTWRSARTITAVRLLYPGESTALSRDSKEAERTMSAQIVQRFGQRSLGTDRDQQDVNSSIGKRTTIMRSSTVFATIIALTTATPVLAEDIKVAIGISGWTGFAPLTLAKEAGIFKKNGLDVDDQEDPAEGPPPRDRLGRHAVRRHHGRDLDRRGTPTASPTKQIFQLDKCYGADGMVVRNDIATISDLKGKTVAASAPGTAPYFTLAWFLKKNGLSVKDVTVVNLEPAAAAQAFVAGQNDAAMTYEPYLSTVRAKPASRQDHRDHARLPDDHGHVRLHAEVPGRESRRPRKALADSYFEALDMIKKDQAKSYEIMGADVKQTGEQFGKSAEVPALAGQGREPEVLRRRAAARSEGGRRPAARDRHHQGRCPNIDDARRHAASSSQADQRTPVPLPCATGPRRPCSRRTAP